MRKAISKALSHARSPNLARATEKAERSNVAQKCSEAHKMLNQASMLQHFLIPTASNGSPSSVLLRRDLCARGFVGAGRA
jgi:hypothetical protein